MTVPMWTGHSRSGILSGAGGAVGSQGRGCWSIDPRDVEADGWLVVLFFSSFGEDGDRGTVM